MGQEREPGKFILEAADASLHVAGTLTGLGSSEKARALAENISLSFTFLTLLGKEVSDNACYFKDNFPDKFRNFTLKWEVTFDTILAATERFKLWTKSQSGEDSEDLPQNRSKRFLWKLGMDEAEFDKLKENLEESLAHIGILQSIVRLITLQIRGRERPLTVSEEGSLRKLKNNMGPLLEVLRDTKIGSVMAFSLAEPREVANACQILEEVKSRIQEEISADNASTADASVTVRNPSQEDVATPLKNEHAAPVDESPVLKEEPTPQFKESDIFEMHRTSLDVRKTSKQTLFRLFGITFKIDRNEKEPLSWVEKVPTTQDDIKKHLERVKCQAASSSWSALEVLMNATPALSPAIYDLVNSKNDAKRFRTHQWSLEYISPTVSKEMSPSRLRRRKKRQDTGYLVVLKGERECGHHGPPPPPGWLPGPSKPPIIVMQPPPANHKKSAVQIELTRDETEKVINDFLASFSTLYDGVALENRGALLKSIEVGDGRNDGYDSDDSASSDSSSSLVDD